MFKISVPLVRFYDNVEKNIEEAKKLGAERIFFCLGRATAPKEKIDSEIARLEKAIKIYENAGFETGVWISTLGHGGALAGLSSDTDSDLTLITGLHGITTEDSYCPLDERFSDAVCDYLKRIASAGAKMILLDDDYRFSHRSDCGCTCKLHMKEYEKRLGETISRDEILKKVFTGGYNKYRQIYYDMMGDTLRDFAKKMRAAIDEIDENIRFGLCAVTSTWDCDGTDGIELAKIMAGKTKPFLRLIGAPYWTSENNHLQYIAELERMQAKWCENSGVEIIAEGDTYPRPRFRVPAAYLEMFDMIIRAENGFDGIMKYGIDYTSSPFYETGYAENAEKNKDLYDEIKKHFSNKKSVGINITCEMKKLLNENFTDPEKQIGSTWDDAFYQAEQRLLTDCSIPATYETAKVTVAFGENAKYIKNSGNGFIIDAEGAEILNNKGIDTGVISVNKDRKINTEKEHFIKENEDVFCGDFGSAVEIIPKENAEILSVFSSDKSTAPSCIKYENNLGQRFLVLCGDLFKSRRNTGFTRSYMRQSQLIREYEWLAEEKLPAVCRKHPDLYILAKKSENSMAVGLWNIFPDRIFEPVVELDKKYSRIEFINCKGSLNSNKVIIDGDIQSFTFCGFEVYE